MMTITTLPETHECFAGEGEEPPAVWGEASHGSVMIDD